MKINNITINTTDIRAAGERRYLSVSGEPGAKFKVQIYNAASPTEFYNFETKAFVDGNNNSTQFLSGDLGVSFFNIPIDFPASGSAYKIMVHADHLSGTTIESSLSNNPAFWSTDISQTNANVTVRLTPITTNTNNFASMPSNIDSTGIPNSSVSVAMDVNWTISSAASNTYGYGLVHNNTYVFDIDADSPRNGNFLIESMDEMIYFTTTDTVDGATSSSAEVKVDDTTDLAVGMQITGISGGGSLSGTPTVQLINHDTKTLVLSSSQTFPDGNTLTFKGYGQAVIKNAIGLDFSANPSAWSYKESIITRQVRSNASDANIALNGTRGISANTTIAGLGVNNAGTNRVQSVTLGASHATLGSGAGSIQTQLDQTGVAQGNYVTIYGSTDTVTLTGKIQIYQYPSADRVIYMDLDKFINIGTQTP